MRQRGAIPRQTRLSRALWSLPVVALSLLLALSALPFGATSLLAAPPEPNVSTAEDDSVAAEDASAQDDAKPTQIDLLPDGTAQTPSSDVSDASKRSPKNGPRFESIRRRGLEAPVQLRQDQPAPPQKAEEEADEGDGEPPKDRSTSDSGTTKDTEKKDSPKRLSPQRDIRVWPMRADSYSFTQAFGCTQQIANFYFPDPGCPASAPVVHSGVDLAAPEGTPFYAAASGWVTGSGYDREVGVPNTRIIIQHDGRNEGYATEYLHWIASFVDVGDYVEAGEQIGEVGSVGYSTGPHLHFSVVDLDSGEHTDPVRWLPDQPGSTGYRGIRPKTRAQMRLPAGTTAGVPEWEDPAPPPPPEREDVPEAPQPEKDKSTAKGDGKDRSGKKHDRRRDERRAEKRAAKDDQADQSADENASAPETTTDDTVREGQDKERTKKRERNKDGKQSENAEKGEDGGKKAKDDKSDSSGNGKNNGGRHGNGDGNGNGNGHGNGNNHQNDKRDDGKVNQRKSNDNGNEDTPPDDGSGDDDNGDQENPSGDDVSTGDGSGSGGESGGDKGDGGNGERENGAETPAEEPARASESGDSEDQAASETRDNSDKEKNRGAAEAGE